MAEVPAPEGQINGAVTAAAPKPSEPVGSKRQRRPSVRLGEIGHQPSDSHTRRTTKAWRLNFPNAPSGNNNKPSKTRPLTNLTSASDFGETLETDDREEPNNNNKTDGVVIGSWRVKDSKKRGSSSNSSKRPRSSNWVSSRIDEGDDDVDDGYYRDFDADNSESPIHYSTENLGDDEREAHAQQQHYHHQGHFRDRNNNGSCGEDGVRIWLNGLGLGRYAPVFQIHEVDDEVLPLLTLEDLKDMGINAVGSRRKMYCAIQKLGKGFT